MKTVTLAQQATTLTTKTSGKELVLSTLLGALLALGLWFGLSLWPSLLMLVLWLSLASLWVARRLVRLVAGRFPALFLEQCLDNRPHSVRAGDSGQRFRKRCLDSRRDALHVISHHRALWLACIALLERWRPLDSSSTELHSGD